MIRAIIFDLVDLKPLLDHVLEVFQPENEEEMFLLVTEELGVAPEECVFIDDNQKFIDVAQSVGMQAILVFMSHADMTVNTQDQPDKALYSPTPVEICSKLMAVTEKVEVKSSERAQLCLRSQELPVPSRTSGPAGPHQG